MGLIIIIVIGAYFLMKYFNENKNNTNIFSEKSNAVDLLNKRYAEGEISEEEYNKIKRALKN